MSKIDHADIRIGTMVSFSQGANLIRQILPYGFECFELNAWMYLGNVDLPALATELMETMAGQAFISSVGVYGNPLQDHQTEQDWATLIKNAHIFGANVVCGFAGALEDRPVDQSMDRFKEVWTPLAKLAEDHGVRIAFENCDMGGTWERPSFNIAHSPRAWELMFNAVPSPALGLEWEPCHQMVSLIDPIRQLRKWVSKVYHVHGKDATVNWDVIEDQGLRGGHDVVWHRTPGFGDTNWSDVISILRFAGYQGTIDIEGYHDPVYKDALEWTGQVAGLNYLKSCRGGDFIPTPSP